MIYLMYITQVKLTVNCSMASTVSLNYFDSERGERPLSVFRTHHQRAESKEDEDNSTNLKIHI